MLKNAVWYNLVILMDKVGAVFVPSVTDVAADARDNIEAGC